MDELPINWKRWFVTALGLAVALLVGAWIRGTLVVGAGRW